ncbi:MAG: bifunctional hydroxymethylpyrimidine kinase/phosphomethylpyrimidine kinase [Bacteroidota bacterium]
MQKTDKTTYPAVLSIAGSDSGGGAGIQADIKSISACGAFAATVVTATTAQNTQGVSDIHAIPVAHIERQLDAVLRDIAFGAIKIGMLHSCAVIDAVQRQLAAYPTIPIVIDPVMVATSGDKLIADAAIDGLQSFLPSAALVTPNVPEAALLLGKSIDASSFASAAVALGQRYRTNILLKGGHLALDEHQITDLLYLYETDQIISIIHPIVHTANTHGTGCSLSSSISAFISLGYGLEEAVRKGCDYVHTAIINGKDKILGKGKGPINHFGI